MNRVITFSLINPIYFTSVEDSIPSLLSSVVKEKPGFDFLIEYKFSFSDELLDLTVINKGIHFHPHTLEKEENPNPENSFALIEGKYRFMQLPSLEKEDEIKKNLLPFLGEKKEGIVFIRFFKESFLESVTQFFLPLEKK